MADSQGYINTGVENDATLSSGVTIKLTSLANGSAITTGDNFLQIQGWYYAYDPITYMAGLDFHAVLNVKTGASVSGTGSVNIYVVGSHDFGTTWTSNVNLNGNTLTIPPDVLAFWKLGSISTPVAATTYRGGPWSVGQMFGGLPPSIFGFIVENQSGGALASSGAGSISIYPWIGVLF